jgi:hypothetical protein
MARTAFKPTAEQKRLVKVLSAHGIRQEDIATEVGLRSPKTLRKHFRKELDLGRISADIAVGKTLYQMASSGKCIAATIYWENRKAARQARKLVAVTRPAAVPDFVVTSDQGPLPGDSGRNALSAPPPPTVPSFVIPTMRRLDGDLS